MNIDVEKCGITRYPKRVLTEKARPVEQINDNIRDLAEKMKDIMVETGGIGLAAPQAGVGLRMFVISLDGTKDKARVYINPEIKPSGPIESMEEGCLSIPGLNAKIKRYKKCEVTAEDEYGQSFTEQADGLYAKALQHEYDHLEGRMIKDRMSQVGRIAARRILKNLELQEPK